MEAARNIDGRSEWVAEEFYVTSSAKDSRPATKSSVSIATSPSVGETSAPTEVLELHLKAIAAQGAQIVMIARDDQGKRFTVQVSDFRPYFYVPQSEEKTIRKKGLEYEVGRVAIDGTPTYRVFVDTPGSVPKRRKGFSRTWEADVPYTRRFLVDAGIHDGFELVGEYIRMGETNILAKMENLKPVSFRTPDRQVLYDIETNKPEGSKRYSPPLEATGAITALSYHDSFEEGRYVTYYWHPERGTPGRPKIEYREQWSDAYQRTVPWTIYTFGAEEEMLVGVIQYLKKSRPDVLQAWNGHHGHHRKNKGGFDAPYIINRLRRIGLSPGQLSPLGNAYAGYKVFGKETETSNGKWQCAIDGLQLVDGMTVYQIKEGGFTAQVPFSDLKRVTKKFTGKKLKKDPSAIEDWWLNNTEEFLTYSFNDVDALVALEISEGYLAFARDMQQFVGCEDSNRLFTPMALIDSMLLRIAKEENVCVPTSDYDDDEYEAEGGFVLEPQIKGLQRRVGVLDLTTMYVHVIISCNLSPETHVPNPTEEQMRDLICVPSDLGPQFFLKPSVKEGILPKVCQRFRAVRKKYDDLIAAAQTQEEVKKLKHARQPAKQLLLGVWGTSLSQYFRLFKPEVGSSITGTGRYIIQNTRDHVRSLGDNVFYVDTDSNFVPLPGDDNKPKDEKIVEHGEWLSDQINVYFDTLSGALNMDAHGFEIGLEKIYDPFIMGDSKKMYAGYVVWSEGKWQIDEQGNPLPDDHGEPRNLFDATGIPGIKSDAAPITRDASEAVLRALLNGVPAKEVLEYIQILYDGVLAGDIPVDQIIKAVTMNLDPDSLDPKVQSNWIIKGVRYGRTMYDYEYPIGSKVRVIRVKGGEDSWLAIPDTEDLPDDTNLDLEHHADLTVLRPLQSLLNWVDLSVASVRHGTVMTLQRRL